MKLLNYLEEYKTYLEGLNHKEITIKRKLSTLKLFAKVSTNSMDLRDIKEKEIIHFANYLNGGNSKNGTQNQKLSILRQFFIWVYKYELTIMSISELVPSVKAIYKERTIFTVEEITLFLDSIDIDSIRDRLFFELLYSSGLRCAEAYSLKWKDISISTRKLRVEQGKGNRDRYIPFSLTVSMFLKKWKKENYTNSDDYMFPGNSKGHICYITMSRRFYKYLDIAEIEKKGLTIHSIRHSCATHLLESGADVRYVSELLGHNSIETTVKYTHPSNESQIKAYKMYHPRENGYFKEMDNSYMKNLKVLRAKFISRTEYLALRN